MEKKFKMSKIETFFKFKKKIDSIKEKTIEKLNLIKKQKKQFMDMEHLQKVMFYYNTLK